MEPTGSIVEGYAIISPLGSQGGMGRVYQALRVADGSRCVVKTLPVGATSELNRMALEREVRLLRGLNHPHIVAILDDGMHEKLGRYIVTEWLDHDLEHRIKSNPFKSWEDFWEGCGKSILDALAFMYANNVAHRDVKPANVMFTGMGTAKLIDFGIGVRTTEPRLGATLGFHKSPGYSPPEQNARDAARDVYGFGATAVSAVTSHLLCDEAGLLLALDKVDAPETVRSVLLSCVAEDPDDRPRNVIELKRALHLATPITESRPGSARPIVQVRATPAVITSLRDRLGGVSLADLLQSFATGCYASFPMFGPSNDPNRMQLDGCEYSLIATQDFANPGVLVLLAAVEQRATRWSHAQSNGFRFDVELRETGHAARSQISEAAIDGILGSLRAAGPVATGADPDLFERWRTILRAQSELCSRKFPIIRFSDLESDGNRLIAVVDGDIDTSVVGVAYFVDDGVQKIAAGIVESVADRVLTIYCAHGFDRTDLPSFGRLRYNAAGTESAIRAQEDAIDRLQKGLTPNPQLAGLITAPESAPTGTPTDDYIPAISYIDEDKQCATKLVLGNAPIFLVVGPPGTGKTDLIAEIALQSARRNPEAKVLVAAQTHMAVDNALSRVREADPSIACIRLGRSTEKLSPGSAELALERQALQWKERVTTRSSQALEAYGTNRGVDIAELQIQRAARAVMHARQRLAELEKQRTAVLSELSSSPVAADNESRNSDLEASLLELEQAHAAMQRSAAESESAAWSLGPRAVDLIDALTMESTPLTISTSDVHLERVLEITSQWLQRLTSIHEFFPAVLDEAQVVGGTCVGFVGSPGADQLTFDVAIVEEASRARPGEVLVAAARAKQVILVGDDKQLPPFIERELVSSEWLDANGLSRSDVSETLFDRMKSRLPRDCIKTLTLQYRMLPEISDLLAYVFYPGALEAGEGAGASAVSLTSLGFSSNVHVRSTSRLSDRAETPANPGFANEREADEVRKALTEIARAARRRKFSRTFEVALLTPYLAQKKVMEQQVNTIRHELRNVEVRVETVHTFQGKQADVVIYSMVRSNTYRDFGFTDDPRLANVAFSRGRGGLLIIGDTELYERHAKNGKYRDAFDFIRSRPESYSFMRLKDAQH